MNIVLLLKRSKFNYKIRFNKKNYRMFGVFQKSRVQ